MNEKKVIISSEKKLIEVFGVPNVNDKFKIHNIGPIRPNVIRTSISTEIIL